MSDLIISPKTIKNLRVENQDVFAHFDTAYGALFVLSDGMGGANDGLLAADRTVHHFPDHLQEAFERALPPPEALDYAARAANREVHALSCQKQHRMGCTLVAALRTQEGFFIVHVGDSRAYYITPDRIVPLTHDHSAVQVWQDEGRMTQEEAWVHPKRGMLTRAIGIAPEVEPVVRDEPIDLEVGEGLLLCSDGLCGFSRDSAIARCVRETQKIQDVASKLVALALKSGSDDNTTVLYIHRCESDTRPAPPPLSQPPRASGSSPRLPPPIRTRPATAGATRPRTKSRSGLASWLPIILIVLVGVVLTYLNYSKIFSALPDHGKDHTETGQTILSDDEAEKPIQVKTEVDYTADFNWQTEECEISLVAQAKNVLGNFEVALRDSLAIDAQEEADIGRKYAEELESQFSGKIDTDRAWAEYLNKLGQSLIADVERRDVNYQFHYIDDDIENALSLPGGYIYVFRGLLEKVVFNEAQLVFLLNHEIHHVDARHSLAFDQIVRKVPGTDEEQFHTMLSFFLNQPFSLTRELECDSYALKAMLKKGYSPYQAAPFLKALGPEEGEENEGLGILGTIASEVKDFITTHPDSQRRVCEIRNQAVHLVRIHREDSFYVGTTNYRLRLPASEEVF